MERLLGLAAFKHLTRLSALATLVIGLVLLAVSLQRRHDEERAWILTRDTGSYMEAWTKAERCESDNAWFTQAGD